MKVHCSGGLLSFRHQPLMSKWALAWGRAFFPWYNHEHRHSGIAFLTPADAYFGRAETVLADRHDVLLAAYAAHPERFPNALPRPQLLPAATYINPPHPTVPLPWLPDQPASTGGDHLAGHLH